MKDKEIEIEPEVDQKFKLRLEARVKNAALIGAREKLGFTQKQVAEQIGINQQTYGLYERMRSYPSIEIQEKICDFYKNKGIFLIKEIVFPPELKKTKPRSKYSIDQEIPSSHLIPYSQADKKALTYTHIDEELDKKELKRELEEVLNTLTPREAEVITLYFDLDEENPDLGRPLTLEEIGKLFNRNKETIRVIKEKAIRRLRHASRSKKLKDFI